MRSDEQRVAELAGQIATRWWTDEELRASSFMLDMDPLALAGLCRFAAIMSGGGSNGHNKPTRERVLNSLAEFARDGNLKFMKNVTVEQIREIQNLLKAEEVHHG